MICPFCLHDKVTINRDLTYPYRCETCNTAFKDADVIAMRKIGFSKYRTMIKRSSNKKYAGIP